jgi:dihydrofolate synthase/folylpolyglutamate synthase
VLEQLEDFYFTPQQIAEGLHAARWPARLEPLAQGYWHDFLPAGDWQITLDGGHNPHAAHVIANWLYGQSAPRHLVLGMLKNKDLRGYLDPLRGLVSHIYATDIPYGYGCYAAEEIRAIAKEMGFFASAYAIPEEAMQEIARRNEGTILIAGSLYLAGYILSKLTNY